MNDRQTFQISRIEIGERTNPQYLNLSALWRNTSIKMPGNVYSWDQQGDSAIFVYDGESTIVELDRTGNVKERHVLDIPQNTTVSWLRTGVGHNGSRVIVAGTKLGQHIFAFDDCWATRHFDMEKHDGIQDVCVFDLNADGSLEICIGFREIAGVHRRKSTR